MNFSFEGVISRGLYSRYINHVLSRMVHNSLALSKWSLGSASVPYLVVLGKYEPSYTAWITPQTKKITDTKSLGITRPYLVRQPMNTTLICQIRGDITMSFSVWPCTKTVSSRLLLVPLRYGPSAPPRHHISWNLEAVN